MRHDRFSELMQDFLSKGRIAIWGDEDAGSKMIASKLGKQGADVIWVNPQFEGDSSDNHAFSLTRVDPPVEAVLVYVDRPQTMDAIDDCIDANVPLVWLHDAMSPGAATPEAIDKLRAAGIVVIPGLCPMLFMKPVDPAHFCLKWVLSLTGKMKRVRHATQ